MRAQSQVDLFQFLRKQLVDAYLKGDDETYCWAVNQLAKITDENRKPSNRKGGLRSMMHGRALHLASALRSTTDAKVRYDYINNNIVVHVGKKYFTITSKYVSEPQSRVDS